MAHDPNEDPHLAEVRRLDETIRNLRRRLARSIDLQHPELVGNILETIRAQMRSRNVGLIKLDVAQTVTANESALAAFATIVKAMCDGPELEAYMRAIANNIVQMLYAFSEETYADNVH